MDNIEPNPADVQLAQRLVEIRDGARHAADPREPAAMLAAALLDWMDAGAVEAPAAAPGGAAEGGT